MKQELKSPSMPASELKRLIPNVAIVARDLYGFYFKKGVARCFFPQNHSHGDRDPSLRHDRKKNRLFCASQNCLGENGVDAIGLVQQIDRCSFQEAFRKLADHYGVRNGAGKRNSSRHHRAAQSESPEESSPDDPLIPADDVRRHLLRDGYRVVAEIAHGAVHRKIRLEHNSRRQADKDRPEKTFRWEYLANGTWYSGDGGIPKPLYVNSTFRDRDQAGLVVGFEGEAKADLAGEFGMAAFSFKNITAEQAMALADCYVVLWPDNDTSGANQVEGAAQIIHESGQARSIMLLTPPPEFPAAGDIIDAVNELKWDRARIGEFLKTAVPYTNGDRQSSMAVADSDPATVGQPESGRINAITPFRLTNDAVVYIDPNHENEPLKICGRLEVAALTRDVKGDGWGRLLQWTDAEGRAHQWAMPMSLLAGDGSEYRARLLDGGLVILPGTKARNLLTTYIQSTRAEAYALCVPRVGWHMDVFVLPDMTIGAGATEQVLFQTPNESEHLINVSGSLKDWRINVGSSCSGNSRLVLAVSCAFAGPSLSLVGAESGGVHFRGLTSTGKTTALLVGGSVIGGGGRNGFVQSWRTTANGLEPVAELHNDLTLFLDELAQMDPKEAAETAYLLGNGSGKNRMSRSIGARRKLSWCLLFVSAGEITLADHALSAGKHTKGGAEVRLLNVEADAGAGLGLFENLHGAESPDAFSRQLRDAAKRFYGTPLREYLAFVVVNRANAEKAIRDLQADFLKRHVPPGAAGEVSRAAQRFFLIGAAGELATAAGITGWMEGESANAAAKCFENWLARRVGGSGAGDAETAILQVRNFIEVNGASRFQSAKVRLDGRGDPIPEKVINRAGFRVDNADIEALEYLILPEVFRREVCGGFDYQMVARALSERGYLDNQPPHFTKKTPMPEVGNMRFYAIKASILGE